MSGCAGDIITRFNDDVTATRKVAANITGFAFFDVVISIANTISLVASFDSIKSDITLSVNKAASALII